ncbi:interferon-induced GTP-binding protein Mx3-like [Leucoraja erinacea]|uniref:interferon-induced GTP-binding protein Mx3-like n=1 Tax=Leucoraja erinaceus TaxID=7782 RepID=UPI002458B81E|nr:interferon-induced GTP-binding protein Mx3-like [Leucoraja erinacea]
MTTKKGQHHGSGNPYSSRGNRAEFQGTGIPHEAQANHLPMDFPSYSLGRSKNNSFGEGTSPSPAVVANDPRKFPTDKGNSANSTVTGIEKDFWTPAFGMPGAQQAQKEQVKAMDAPLSIHYEHEVRPYIDLIDSLRGFGVDKDLGLPAIAVIGDQSSGKSSVLEALSGVAFPRGSGIVTRCPLELKLKNVKKANVWQGKISYRGYSNYLSSAAEVEQEILKAQDSIAGKGVGISHELISLEVESTNVPDLTLIDLPGIARVAVGNQPQDIGDQTKRLITSFIMKQETINLVVVPCNVDIATTEALKMAQEVDPSGDRTLGILTKPDLVDKGTENNVVDIVYNLTVELAKGYMIVKCRGQNDINENISLVDAIAKEKAFFENHEQFGPLLDDGKAGIKNLAVRLTKELVNHIIKSLPQLRNEIETKLNQSLQSLKKYGIAAPTSSSEQITFLIEKINNFCSHIKNLTMGEEPQDKVDGVRYITKVRNEFGDWNTYLNKRVAKFQNHMQHLVPQYENSYRGRELPGFVNYSTFEAFIKKEVSTLKDPAITKLKTITDITRDIFMVVAEQHFSAFSNLSKAAKAIIANMSQKQVAEAEKLLQAQIKVEGVVYCQDGLYNNSLFEAKGNLLPHLAFTSVQELSDHLHAYYKIVSHRLANQIPMVIRCYILDEFADNLRTEMLQLTHHKDRINDYLMEDEDTQRKRDDLKRKIDRLTKAQEKLFEFV